MRGAIREDDNPSEFPPNDTDVGGVFHREFNHFFDPQKHRPLTRTGIGAFYALDARGVTTLRRAPDWAMGTDDIFNNANARGGDILNNFTIFSAREAMFRAVTMRFRIADGNYADLYPQGVTTVQKESNRKAWWATTFRALGNVLHLNQDMAQPQHTRNEAHSGRGGRFSNSFSGHTSVFEKYLESRARRANYEIDGQATRTYDPLDFGNHAVPTFANYRDYWSTAAGVDGAAPGVGLADYSSRGFLTNANNIGGSEYAAPSTALTAYTKVRTGYPTATSTIKVNLLTAAVPDALAGPSAPIRMATESMWSGLFAGTGSMYSLTLLNYDDHAKLLLPKAVAYSAGLIDYFFRGQMEITPPDEGVYSLVDHYDFSGEGKTPTDVTAGFKGFKTIKLKLRNATPDITPSGGGTVAPQIMPGGTSVAVLKFYRNFSYTDNLASDTFSNLAAAVAAYRAGRSLNEEIVVSTSVKDGNGNPLTGLIPVTNTAQTFIFEFGQELPINATDVKLQVVYRGPLGSEADAVVVQTVDISEPTHFVYMNATDYIKIGTSVYTRAEINAATSEGATLRSKIRPTLCIDPNTNQLIDSPGCMAPIPINFPLYWNTIAPGQIGTIGLDNPGTYHRIATLNAPASTADYYLRASNCLPHDPAIVPGRTVQTNYVPDPAGSGGVSPTAIVDYAPRAIRGVNGWYANACVNNGDGSIPGKGTDDRGNQNDATDGCQPEAAANAAIQVWSAVAGDTRAGEVAQCLAWG